MYPESLPPETQHAPPLDLTTSKTTRPTWKTLLEILDQLCAPAGHARTRFAPKRPKRGTPTPIDEQGSTAAKAVQHGLKAVETAVAAPRPASVPEENPCEFMLHPNQPTPLNPHTTIRFGLPKTAAVRLMVMNRRGRHVQVLVDGRFAAGMHEVVFEAGDLPKGVYLCRLQTPEGSLVKKLMLVE